MRAGFLVLLAGCASKPLEDPPNRCWFVDCDAGFSDPDCPVSRVTTTTDDGPDGVVDWRRVETRTRDAEGLLQTTLTESDNGDNGVDARTERTWTWSDGALTSAVEVRLFPEDDRVTTWTWDGWPTPASSARVSAAPGAADDRWDTTWTWDGDRPLTLVERQDFASDGSVEATNTVTWTWDGDALASRETVHNSAREGDYLVETETFVTDAAGRPTSSALAARWPADASRDLDAASTWNWEDGRLISIETTWSAEPPYVELEVFTRSCD
jgi:hypothetical protein